MKTMTLVRVATDSILKNKMRSSLTMLGIVIGVGAVIVMVAIIYGAQSRIQAQIDNLGTNLIVVTPGSSRQGGVSQGAGTFNRLTVEDADKIAREATLASGVTPVVFTRAQVIGGEGNWRTEINGVSDAYASIRNWPLTYGAFFDEADVRSMRKVAVLGSTVAASLFPDVDPTGASLQIRNVPFTIVGVLAPKGQTSSGGDQDDVVLVPYTTAQNRLAGFSFIGQIIATTASSEDIAPAIEELTAIMREAHGLGGNEDDDFTVRDQTEIAQAAKGTTEVMSWLLGAIASISLLVGGIGIMNIMLVSVTERTREIGIRMAAGARGGDVLTQFLVESVVMSSAGGLAGLVVGTLAAGLLAHFTGWSMATPPFAAVVAVGFSATVGVFFGFYPARKAAALNPIEALRYE